MIESWMMALARGIIEVFIQPILYWSILLVSIASYKRIKRERREFGTKIFDRYEEWKGTWGLSLLVGLALSIGFVTVGFSFPYISLIVLSLVTIIVSASGRFSFLSPVYTIGITYVLMILLPSLNLGVVPDEWVNTWEQTSLTGIGLLLASLLVAEAIFLYKAKNSQSLPQLIKGKRGKVIGQHVMKKIHLVPIFFIVPGGYIEAFAPWWPMFSIHGEAYGLLLAPILVGFEIAFQGTLPFKGIKRFANQTLLLGFVVLALAIASIMYPVLSLATVFLALVGKEIIHFLLRLKDQSKPLVFAPRERGLTIFGVIPNTPADKMGLLVGERIEKVNQIAVNSEQEFYEALQSNRAYCKMEVLNLHGELKFAQRAMYEGDHYELGLVFVKDRAKESTKTKTKKSI